MILPVWICMPHAKVMIQLLQHEDDREVVDDAKVDDSREAKPAKADMYEPIWTR